jgi:hypothetical protein
MQAEREDHNEDDAARMQCRRDSELRSTCMPSDTRRAARVRASHDVLRTGRASRLAQTRRRFALHVR